MDGRVTTCSLTQLHGLLAKATPIFEAISGLKVCIPPLPRYLKTPCCEADGHCEGIADPDYSTELMSKTMAIRRQMKEYMVSRGMVNCWVPDIVKVMFPDCNTTADIAASFSDATLPDSVHLTEEGYAKMAAALLSVAKDRRETNSCIAGSTGGAKSFYWRGFNSPVGSARPKPSVSVYKDQHPGGGKWPHSRNNSYNRPSARGRGGFNPPGGRRWN